MQPKLVASLVEKCRARKKLMKITKFNNILDAITFANIKLGWTAYKIKDNILYYHDGSFNDIEKCYLNIKAKTFYVYIDDEISFITDNEREIKAYLM